MSHLREVGLTYFQHLRRALVYATALQIAVIILIVHSLVPNILQHTGSGIIKSVLEDMKRPR